MIQETGQAIMQMTQGKAIGVTSAGAVGWFAAMTINEWAALAASVLGCLWFCCLLFKFIHRKEWKRNDK